MMQGFVQCHMMSILQPFAERTHELQNQVQQLFAELVQVRETAERQGSSIGSHAEQLSTLHVSAAEVCKGLEVAQAALAAAKRETNRLDGNHEMTKASLGKAKERIDAVSSTAEVLQQSLQDNHARVTGLESALADSEKRVMDEMELRLNKQGKACKALAERQAEVAKACEHAKTLGEKANSALKKLSNDYESRKIQDGGSIASLQELAACIEAKLTTVDSEVQKNTERVMTTDREVQHLKTWTEQLKDISKLHDKNSEAVASLHMQACRIEKVEMDIVEISKDAMSQRQVQNSELNNLEKTVDKNIAETARWMDTQRAHVDLISSAGKRLQDLETGQSTLMAFTNNAEVDIRSLAAWQQHAVKDLEMHGSAVEETRSSLLKAHEAVSSVDIGLQCVKAEVKADRKALEKTGMRVDQCYKYFNGLGKGLQETQRQMHNAEGSMLPPKLGGSAVLPTLPTMPRTPRAGSTPRSVGNVTPRSRARGAT